MLQIHVFPQSISSKYLFDSETCQLSRLQSNKMNFNTCQFVGVLEARLQSTIYMKTECSRSIQFNEQLDHKTTILPVAWLVEINLSIHLYRRDYLNGITFNSVVKAQKLATICVNKPFKVCILSWTCRWLSKLYHILDERFLRVLIQQEICTENWMEIIIMTSIRIRSHSVWTFWTYDLQKYHFSMSTSTI